MNPYEEDLQNRERELRNLGGTGLEIPKAPGSVPFEAREIPKAPTTPNLPTLDIPKAPSPEEMAAAGFIYTSIGRPSLPPAKD